MRGGRDYAGLSPASGNTVAPLSLPHLLTENSEGLDSVVAVDMNSEISIVSVCHQLSSLWYTGRERTMATTHLSCTLATSHTCTYIVGLVHE